MQCTHVHVCTCTKGAGTFSLHPGNRNTLYMFLIKLLLTRFHSTYTSKTYMYMYMYPYMYNVCIIPHITTGFFVFLTPYIVWSRVP